MKLPLRPLHLAALSGVVLLASVGVITLLHQPSSCSDSTCDAAGLPTGPVSYQAIEQHAEAHLVYPGAATVSPFGSGELHYPTGESNSAFSGGVYATTAGADAVYQWYDAWLMAHGWQHFNMARLSTEVSVQGYARGQRERFDVAVEDPTLLSATLGHSVPSGKTVFEARYIIFPASDFASPSASSP